MGESVVRIPAKVVGESDDPRWTVDLPTKDMVAKALPEGVLDSGGEVSGLVYFHKVDR